MRWFVRGLLVVVALFAAAAAALYMWLLGSLPETNGRVAVAGLGAPVEIIRDRHGVPHIYAQSQKDAVFGLGFVHAQDRLWQMELRRRIGQGRLSEIMGEATVATDRFLRTLSVYHFAERNYGTLDRDGRARLDAYAAGVNAYLASRRGPLPPEFLILRHRPEPWRPADSLVWGKMMAWSLSGNWASELLRARLASRLSAEQIADFFAPYPGDSSVALPNLAAFYSALDLEGVSAAMPHRPDPANGSNNWVVAGDRTATAKPLLANDPHLGLAVPSVWYFAHLSAPGLDVIGATLPGVGTVVLGRNKRIAWGFTNTGPDVQDLFIERIDPQKTGQLSDARRITPVHHSPRGPESEGRSGHFRWWFASSRHGPIMSDASASMAETAGEGHAMALAWTALSDIDTTPQALSRLNEARNPEEFVAALRGYQSPQQNIVYADVDGNIGFYAPGRVPIRKEANAIEGRAPVPGWDATYDWQGFIPFEELPHLFQPPAGVIATANHKIVPEGYAHHITFEWEPPYRARRIDAVLNQRNTHSIESFARLQGDETSMMAQDFLPFLRSAQPTSETAAKALKLVANWNGKMGRNMAAPLIFAAWYRELTRLVYADELDELFDDAWAMRPVFMHQVLSPERAVVRRRHHGVTGELRRAGGRSARTRRRLAGRRLWDGRREMAMGPGPLRPQPPPAVHPRARAQTAVRYHPARRRRSLHGEPRHAPDRRPEGAVCLGARAKPARHLRPRRPRPLAVHSFDRPVGKSALGPLS